MRLTLTAALISLPLLILAACKDDVNEIGKFTVMLNNESIEFSSISDKESDRRDIRAMSPSGVRIMFIDGYAGPNADDTGFPIISLVLQSGIRNSSMTLAFVQVFDESRENALIANGSLGQKNIEDLEIEDDGSISFSFSADLVRATVGNEEPIAGAQGAHIEGSFSGIIPASERELP